MILAGTDNIRDVVAFPKTTRAASLMSVAVTRGLVTALVLGDRSHPRLVSREVDVPSDDKGTELRWNGEVFE